MENGKNGRKPHTWTGARSACIVICLMLLMCFCVAPVSAWNTLSDDDKDFYKHPSKEKIYVCGDGQHEAMAYTACIRAGFSENTSVAIMGYAGYPDTKYAKDEKGSHIWPGDATPLTIKLIDTRKPWGWHKVAERHKQFQDATTKEEKIKWAGCILHYISDSGCPYHSTQDWLGYYIIGNHRGYENFIAGEWDTYSGICNTTDDTYTTTSLNLSDSASVWLWYYTFFGRDSYKEFDEHNLKWLKKHPENALTRAQTATNTIAKLLYEEMKDME